MVRPTSSGLGGLSVRTLKLEPQRSVVCSVPYGGSDFDHN